MPRRPSGWIALFWIVVALILSDHLFDIPGLIARHHQGYLGKTFGSWLVWMISISSAAISIYYAVVYTRNWLRLRSAAVK